MKTDLPLWDWLIVTASNSIQAQSYKELLSRREGGSLLNSFRHWKVISDPEGKRIGSGGSTVFCLMDILSSAVMERKENALSWNCLEEIASSLRVMILHAGGDSRRLPAYAPCGKLFVPIPSLNGKKKEGETLFDQLVMDLLRIPSPKSERGQFIVVSADALLRCDFNRANFDFPGMTAVASAEPIAQCTRHGVFCVEADQKVGFYLQKPSIEKMRSVGAILPEKYQDGERALLDVGLMSFDGNFACRLLETFGVEICDGSNQLQWENAIHQRVMELGVDFYREICCTLGEKGCFEDYLAAVRASGSSWSEAELKRFYSGLSSQPLYCCRIDGCEFLHFGTTHQLCSSAALLSGVNQRQFCLNSFISPKGILRGDDYWLDGCKVEGTLFLEGENVLTGVIIEPGQILSLPCGGCLDIIPGRLFDSDGERKSCFFIRPYGFSDAFKESIAQGGTFCGVPLREWLELSRIPANWIWDQFQEERQCTLWNARLFPACESESEYWKWLWYFTPGQRIKGDELKRFEKTKRFNCAEIALLTDLRKYHSWRIELNFNRSDLE